MSEETNWDETENSSEKDNAMTAAEFAPKIFSLEIGGFFQGHRSLTIEERDNRYSASCECFPYEVPASSFEIAGELVEALSRVLRKVGAAKWTAYDAPVLDGTQWTLAFVDEDGLHTSYGSNAFPKGFGELVEFVALAFGCMDLLTESGCQSMLS